MTERNKPHNGRDLGGHFRVKQEDVEALLESPDGADFIRDDVRLGGAVEDIGVHAGESGEHIERLIEDNALDVAKVAGKIPDASTGKNRRKDKKKAPAGEAGERAMYAKVKERRD